MPGSCLQGLSLLLAPSLPVPLAGRALQGQLAVQAPKTRWNPALFSESARRLTKAHYSNLFFQSCIFCRPDSLALPSHTTQLDSNAVICAFTQGTIIAVLTSHCLSVILPNSYLHCLLLGHHITVFNLFCPHVKN